jgi:hypothetical protein
MIVIGQSLSATRARNVLSTHRKPRQVWSEYRDRRGEANFARAEGPAVNSPAREGGGLEDPKSEGRRPGTPTVPHLV